jgi:hypothetical protein
MFLGSKRWRAIIERVSGLGFFAFLLGFFLFQAHPVFANESTQLGIIILFTVKRVIEWAFGMFFGHEYRFPFRACAVRVLMRFIYHKIAELTIHYIQGAMLAHLRSMGGDLSCHTAAGAVRGARETFDKMVTSLYRELNLMRTSPWTGAWRAAVTNEMRPHHAAAKGEHKGRYGSISETTQEFIG